MSAVPDTFNTFNSKAAQYQELYMGDQTYNESYRAFLACLSAENPKILDIACGPGMISRFVLNEMPGSQVLGLDFSPAMIELAGKNVPGARFEVRDCREIRPVRGPFEGIISGFLLHYLSPVECQMLLDDCLSLLAPGGAFYFSLIRGNDEGPVLKLSSDGTAACHVCNHSPETLGNWLLERGMNVSEEIHFPGEVYENQVALLGTLKE